MNPKANGYIRKNKKWQAELNKLRMIILGSPLIEEVKWRQPCYTSNGSNVVIMGVLKEHCVLSFFKGALLKDAAAILQKPGDNTQAIRVIRFKNVAAIAELEAVLRTYITEAIAIERAGSKVKLTEITERKIPDELQNKFDRTPTLKSAFRALTPGRQRAYLLCFSAAKKAETRAARVERCMQRILDGRGLDD